MKTKTKSETPVAGLIQRPPFDAASRRIVDSARILDNFVPPKKIAEEIVPPKITHNPVMKKLHRSYEKWLDKNPKSLEWFAWTGLHLLGAPFHGAESYPQTLFLLYDSARGLLGSRTQYRPKDIERFSLELDQHASHPHFERSGIFLSALINSSNPRIPTRPTGPFTLWLKHLGKSLDYLGFLNQKDVVVYGPAGSYLGLSMSTGQFTVHGDAESIAVTRGGTLSVNGRIMRMDNNQGAGIFQNGRQLVKDGIKIAEPQS